MSPSRIYARICKARSLDKAVEALSSDELASVAEYLSNLKPSGGVPAQVFGMVTARLGCGEKEVAK